MYSTVIKSVGLSVFIFVPRTSQSISKLQVLDFVLKKDFFSFLNVKTLYNYKKL